jgi:hypothetical protein
MNVLNNFGSDLLVVALQVAFFSGFLGLTPDVCIREMIKGSTVLLSSPFSIVVPAVSTPGVSGAVWSVYLPWNQST